MIAEILAGWMVGAVIGQVMTLGFMVNGYPNLSDIPNPLESEDDRKNRVQKANDAKFAAILARGNKSE